MSRETYLIARVSKAMDKDRKRDRLGENMVAGGVGLGVGGHLTRQWGNDEIESAHRMRAQRFLRDAADSERLGRRLKTGGKGLMIAGGLAGVGGVARQVHASRRR